MICFHRHVTTNIVHLRPVRVPELDRPVGASGQECALHVAAPGQGVHCQRVAGEALLVPGHSTKTLLRTQDITGPAVLPSTRCMHPVMTLGVARGDVMCSFLVAEEEAKLRTAVLWPWSTGEWHPPPCPTRTPAPVPAPTGVISRDDMCPADDAGADNGCHDRASA